MRGARGVLFIHSAAQLPSMRTFSRFFGQSLMYFSAPPLLAPLSERGRGCVLSIPLINNFRYCIFNSNSHIVILASRPISIGDFSKARFFCYFFINGKSKIEVHFYKKHNKFQQKTKTIYHQNAKTHPQPLSKRGALSVTL